MIPWDRVEILLWLGSKNFLELCGSFLVHKMFYMFSMVTDVLYCGVHQKTRCSILSVFWGISVTWPERCIDVRCLRWYGREDSSRFKRICIFFIFCIFRIFCLYLLYLLYILIFCIAKPAFHLVDSLPTKRSRWKYWNHRQKRPFRNCGPGTSNPCMVQELLLRNCGIEELSLSLSYNMFGPHSQIYSYNFFLPCSSVPHSDNHEEN